MTGKSKTNPVVRIKESADLDPFDTAVSPFATEDERKRALVRAAERGDIEDSDVEIAEEKAADADAADTWSASSSPFAPEPTSGTRTKVVREPTARSKTDGDDETDDESDENAIWKDSPFA